MPGLADGAELVDVIGALTARGLPLMGALATEPDVEPALRRFELGVATLAPAAFD